VRQATDILHEIGRHLAGSVSAQREGIDEPTKAAVDCGDDLIVSAHRREEMGYVIWHLLRPLHRPCRVRALSLWPRSSRPWTANTG